MEIHSRHQLIRTGGAEHSPLRLPKPGLDMHVFRSMIAARAKNSTPQAKVTPARGHADGPTAEVRRCEGEMDLLNKQFLLEAIDFKINLLPTASVSSTTTDA
ncbi:hypothetical protein [Rhodoferax sediminis]|uniref:Uncharacterized protein n=1 Tax=Rhodoferax sediminis TaxID=2509614 RepID=A0A515D6D7_9BURK|nr:hypothetical protein [Rhodoferax sediminis]QDL35962.1 hypothetical protein EUB48_00630 [Rhodoferax sediminis]